MKTFLLMAGNTPFNQLRDLVQERSFGDTLTKAPEKLTLRVHAGEGRRFGAPRKAICKKLSSYTRVSSCTLGSDSSSASSENARMPSEHNFDDVMLVMACPDNSSHDPMRLHDAIKHKELNFNCRQPARNRKSYLPFGRLP
ncbi:unnamed protein product [Pleuronectes platessa]|uniref:Uncharacterized protein n=1 Tax=Pleuronectes platessa TaxID=8262 RepID=A0A9N7VFG5_PLEPL|nr:unnamed protein product [Pleuronectes platessa]